MSMTADALALCRALARMADKHHSAPDTRAEHLFCDMLRGMQVQLENFLVDLYAIDRELNLDAQLKPWDSTPSKWDSVPIQRRAEARYW